MAEQENATQQEGLFFDSLKMNGKEIRDMRAKQLGMGAAMAYKSKVENLYFKVQQLEMEQVAALDLSPDNALSFIKVADFDPARFTEKDIEMAVELRNAKIKFLAALQRYESLFGRKYDFDGREDMVKSLNF